LSVCDVKRSFFSGKNLSKLDKRRHTPRDWFPPEGV
jgi:hypothetical protein